MLAVGFIVIFLMLLWGVLVAPAKLDETRREPFCGRMFAHRGLFTTDQRVPENSLAAFSRAAESGYGVELDVQITSDGEIVVFHDSTLERACSVSGTIAERTLAEVRALRLFGTEHGIPLFSEALSTLNGRVPLIVELKAHGAWRQLCEKVRQMLAEYDGDACIESFDPFLVQWFRKNAPDTVRGQLSEAYRFSRRSIPWYLALLMSRLLTNAFTRPHFVAYRIGPKCLSARLCSLLGAMNVAWTAHEGDGIDTLQAQNDAVIFEHFAPDTTF